MPTARSAAPAISAPITPPALPVSAPARQPLAQYQIIRRNGAVVGFEPRTIAGAMM